MKALSFFAAAAFAVVASQAQATTFVYNGPLNGVSGTDASAASLNHLLFRYDDQSQELSFNARWNASTAAPNGMWLVLSNGPMPNGYQTEFPIYYVDFRAESNRISAYTYGGTTTAFSDPSRYLATFDKAVSVSDLPSGGRQAQFSVNLSGINASAQGPDWKGGGFGSVGSTTDIGVWMEYFQQSGAQSMRYTGTGADARLSGVSYIPGTRGWVDFSQGNATQVGGCAPTPAKPCPPPPPPTPCVPTPPAPGQPGCHNNPGKVPEPTVPMIMGLGLFALAASRRWISSRSAR